MSYKLNLDLKYTTGFLSAICMSVGTIGLFWMYKGGCTDFQENYNILARNIGVVAMVFLSMNFFSNSDEKIEKLSLISWIFSRYYLVYMLVPSAVNKIMNLHYNYSYAAAHERIMDMDPQNLIWTVYSSSDTYEMLIGVAQIIIILMLTFRRTTPIAVLLLLPILINNLAITAIFDSCYILSYTRFVFLTFGILLYLVPELLEWVRAIKFKKLLWLEKARLLHARNIINILKIILIVGLMIQQFWKLDRSKYYYKINHDHPIVGIWDVESVNASTKDFPDFNKLIFEETRVGNVEVQDSLSQFYYVVDTIYNQLEFYGFHEFRSLDLKGKYEMLDSTTLKYVGRNNKDSLQFVLKKHKVKNSLIE